MLHALRCTTCEPVSALRGLAALPGAKRPRGSPGSGGRPRGRDGGNLSLDGSLRSFKLSCNFPARAKPNQKEVEFCEPVKL